MHKIANCYYLNKDMTSVLTSHLSNTTQAKENAFLKKRNADGKKKQAATKANKQNTLKQLCTRQMELEKELAEMEVDNNSNFDVVINSTRITDWMKTDKVGVLSQASELSFLKPDDETVKKMEQHKKARFAR